MCHFRVGKSSLTKFAFRAFSLNVLLVSAFFLASKLPVRTPNAAGRSRRAALDGQLVIIMTGERRFQVERLCLSAPAISLLEPFGGPSKLKAGSSSSGIRQYRIRYWRFVETGAQVSSAASAGRAQLSRRGGRWNNGDRTHARTTSPHCARRTRSVSDKFFSKQKRHDLSLKRRQHELALLRETKQSRQSAHLYSND